MFTLPSRLLLLWGWLSGLIGWKNSSTSVVSNPFLFFGRVLFFFALGYLTWVPLYPAYTKVLCAITNEVFFFTQLSAPPTYNKVTSLKSKGSDIFVSHCKYGTNCASAKIEEKPYHMNMVLMIALVLASPRLNMYRRFRLLLISIGALFLIHVILTVFDVKLSSMHHLSTHTGEQHEDFIQYIYCWGKTFYEVIGWKFFPFLIWAVLCYKTLFFREETLLHSDGKKRLHRNDPCPCGSGRKYKRCCGTVG